MSDRLIARIVDFVKKPGYRPLRVRSLAKAMHVGEADYRAFSHAVDDAVNDGMLTLGGGNLVRPAGTPGRVTGTFRAHRKGFGFVTPDVPTEDGDLFVPPGATLNAQSGDTVACRVKRTGYREGKPSFTAEVVEIVRRENTQCVGTLCHEAGRWFVQPDGTKLHQAVFVDDVGAKQARKGDVVVVEITQFPEAGQVARGVIVERLGARGKVGVDVLAIIRQYRLPDTFSTAAIDDARAAAQSFNPQAELEHRLDLRETLTVTIDPVDAKDFDDAISLRRLDGGGDAPARRGKKRSASSAAAWELGVHIADVSHFVREGGDLDAESLERGTSVYFPRHVVPMLPELLSNGVCSLQEHQPRFCKSAFIQYDLEGRVVGAHFANTIIHSDKRLTYEQASAVLTGDTGDLPHAVVKLMLDMEKLARAIRKRRLEEGMLVLDLPEVVLELDDEGRVVDAHPADQSFSHTIIEMFMVEANEAVARFLTAGGETFLRRVHPAPDPDVLEELSHRLRGARCTIGKHPDRHELQRILDSVKGKPASRVVNMAVLRSMAQAVYSPADDGHYALASKDYCHFTSPIRRYPDLHIHRLLQKRFEQAELPRSARKPRRHEEVEDDPQAVAALGKHCSVTERRAEKAERELKLVKVLELLVKHQGEVFDGFVTGVTSFGVFVQHPRYMVDGLLEVNDLPDDRWQFDQMQGALIGRRTGRRIAVGDPMRVAIARVDVTTRRFSVAVVDETIWRAPTSSAPEPVKHKSWNRPKKQARRGRGRR